MASILDCSKIQPRLGEYIDGALEGNQAWDFKLHISSCAVCARVADELTATTRLLRDLPVLAPSTNFEAALAQRLANNALRPQKPTPGSRFADWWYSLSAPSSPRLHPALATSLAVVALIPGAFLVNQRLQAVSSRTTAAAVKPVPVRTVLASAAPGSDETLDELWREHTSYASSEPLADPAGMLQARTAAPPPGNTTNSADISL